MHSFDGLLEFFFFYFGANLTAAATSNLVHAHKHMFLLNTDLGAELLCYTLPLSFIKWHNLPPTRTVKAPIAPHPIGFLFPVCK